MEAAATDKNTWEAAIGDYPRLQRSCRLQWWLWVGICVLASGIVYGFVSQTWGISAVVVSVIICLQVTQFLRRKLSRYYKTHIIPQVVEQYCAGGRYNALDGIDEETFMSSCLFNTTPDRYDSEDMIEGHIGQTAFHFSEVRAQKEVTIETKNGTHTTWVDIFRGVMFVADFNKDFKGLTTPVPNSGGRKWLAGRDRVEPEKPQLMKAFLVCSTDQIEARYLLTPGLMERIMGLWKRYPKQLSISFTGSCILVARSCSKNHYEASLWKSLEQSLERDMALIDGMTSIVEELNMNTRIWSKE